MPPTGTSKVKRLLQSRPPSHADVAYLTNATGLNPVQKVSLAFIRFLTYHNRLEGLMAFLGVWWGSWTLLFPGFWLAWPSTVVISHRMYNHPELISLTLLITGIVGYLGWNRKWFVARTSCTFVSFIVWGMLCLNFLTVAPVFSPGVACYSAFALSSLMAYIYVQMGIDKILDTASTMRQLEHPCSGENIGL